MKIHIKKIAVVGLSLLFLVSFVEAKPQGGKGGDNNGRQSSSSGYDRGGDNNGRQSSGGSRYYHSHNHRNHPRGAYYRYYAPRDYVYYKNHRGYWDTRGGIRFFINID